MSDNVLHVCLSKGWGGLEQYPLTLASHLSSRGISVQYWGLTGSQFVKKAYLDKVFITSFSSRMALACRLLFFKKWLLNQQFKVVHFHKSSDLRLVPLFRWLMPTTRLIFTEHMNAKKPKNSLYHWWVYRCLHQVIAISDHSLANNLRALPVDVKKIKRLYAGIDLNIFRPNLSQDDRLALRNNFSLTKDDIALCLPGRISNGKGHDVFIDAVLELSKNYKGPGRIQAFIVGGLKASEGAHELLVNQLKERINVLKVNHLFTFTGFSTEIHNLLQAMDVVCIPSTQEAFGLSVVESMALGLPVVGSNSGAIPEILGLDGNHGLLAEPQNPHSFAAAFSCLVASSSLRLSIGQRGLEYVKLHFNIVDHVDRLLKIYELKNL